MNKNPLASQEPLSKITQEIDIILSNFAESKNEDTIKNAINIIKKIQLNILSMRLETFLLGFNMNTIWAPFLDDMDRLDTDNILGDLNWIQKDLSEYSKQLNSIKYEMKNLYNEAELVFTLRRISIMTKLVCGKYALITEIDEKLKGDKLVKKK